MQIIGLIIVAVVIYFLLTANKEYKEADNSISDLVIKANEASTKGDYNKAIQLLTSALQKNYMYYNVWNFRGENYIKLKMYKEALADFERSVKVRPDRNVNKLAYEKIEFLKWKVVSMTPIPDGFKQIVIEKEEVKSSIEMLPPLSNLSLSNIINHNEGCYKIDNINSMTAEIGKVNMLIVETQLIRINFDTDTVFFDSNDIRELLKVSKTTIRNKMIKNGDLILFLRSTNSDEYYYDSSFGEEIQSTDFVFFIKQYSFHIANVKNETMFRHTNYKELQISHIE